MNCPKCKEKIVMAKAGWAWSGRRQIHRYKCRACGYVYADPQVVKPENKQEK